MKLVRPMFSMALIFVLLGTALAASAWMSVQVKEASLRSSPTFLSPVVTTLAYADRVQVTETKGDWSRIKASQGNGWLHASALSERHIVLDPGDVSETGASSEDLALAGKGFNKQVEKRYASEKGLDYDWVDRMEQYEVSPGEAREFLIAGQVIQ